MQEAAIADREILEAIGREQSRLRTFIRNRVPDPEDVEDVLQDVFYEFVEAHRLLKPIERVGSWMFRVAQNRIFDLFRGGKTEPLLSLEELLPSPDAGPDAEYARSVIVDAIEAALAELPAAQRSVFIANEVDGVSFRELAEQTGVNINTLLSRKRAAVLFLRRRLRHFYSEIEKE